MSPLRGSDGQSLSDLIKTVVTLPKVFFPETEHLGGLFP